MYKKPLIQLAVLVALIPLSVSIIEASEQQGDIKPNISLADLQRYADDRVAGRRLDSEGTLRRLSRVEGLILGEQWE